MKFDQRFLRRAFPLVIVLAILVSVSGCALPFKAAGALTKAVVGTTVGVAKQGKNLLGAGVSRTTSAASSIAGTWPTVAGIPLGVGLAPVPIVPSFIP